MEVWKPVEGFEGRYEVSNHGRVRSLGRWNDVVKNCYHQAREMKLHLHTNKYQVVWLRKPGTHQKFYVHRLVEYTFLDLIEGKDYVNHKDKDRCHNHVRNLEFMTHQENCDHRDGKTTINNEDW